MVHEAIYSGDHHCLVGKNLIPFDKWLICGDQQRASLVTRTDQLEQNAGLGMILEMQDLVILLKGRTFLLRIE